MLRVHKEDANLNFPNCTIDFYIIKMLQQHFIVLFICSHIYKIILEYLLFCFLSFQSVSINFTFYKKFHNKRRKNMTLYTLLNVSPYVNATFQELNFCAIYIWIWLNVLITFLLLNSIAFFPFQQVITFFSIHFPPITKSNLPFRLPQTKINSHSSIQLFGIP